MGWGQQIGQEIGRGGFGTVFQALNTATGDFVAVKRMEMDSVKLDAGASIKVCVYLTEYPRTWKYIANLAVSSWALSFMLLEVPLYCTRYRPVLAEKK